MPPLVSEAESWLANRIRGLNTESAVNWANDVGLTGQRVYTAPELRRTATRAPAPGELTDPQAPSATVQVEHHPGGDRYILPASTWLRPQQDDANSHQHPRPASTPEKCSLASDTRPRTSTFSSPRGQWQRSGSMLPATCLVETSRTASAESQIL